MARLTAQSPPQPEHNPETETTTKVTVHSKQAGGTECTPPTERSTKGRLGEHPQTGACTTDVQDQQDPSGNTTNGTDRQPRSRQSRTNTSFNHHTPSKAGRQALHATPVARTATIQKIARVPKEEI